MKSIVTGIRGIVTVFVVMALAVLLGNYKPSLFFASETQRADTFLFSGNGTQEDPFLITCTEELMKLRDSVNTGTDFSDVYFYQTCDIDLGADTVWEPIGKFGSEKYFYGIYDGGAHRIYNLHCRSDGSGVSNSGLFGVLGGTVLNLGIESGSVEGDYIGSITSHATGETAAIINCYNRADIIGTGRAGGICDNFSGGLVANCVNAGNVQAPLSGQIVSYNAKYVINVFPQTDAVSPVFTGSLSNYTMDGGQIYEMLNAGVDYLEEMESFTDYELRHWNVGED